MIYSRHEETYTRRKHLLPSTPRAQRLMGQGNLDLVAEHSLKTKRVIKKMIAVDFFIMYIFTYKSKKYTHK